MTSWTQFTNRIILQEIHHDLCLWIPIRHVHVNWCCLCISLHKVSRILQCVARTQNQKYGSTASMAAQLERLEHWQKFVLTYTRRETDLRHGQNTFLHWQLTTVHKKCLRGDRFFIGFFKHNSSVLLSLFSGTYTQAVVHPSLLLFLHVFCCFLSYRHWENGL